MTLSDEAIRRAAVLVSCLDETDARALLGRLGTAPADRLRRAVEALGPVAAVERDHVIRAFLLSRQTAIEDESQGVELHEDLARRLSDIETPAASGQPRSTDSETAEAPFAFLLETESDVVAPFLARENPQTIAVVLSFLGRRQAAELLSRLDSGVRAQVLKRLAGLDGIDPASIDVVAAELRTWLERQRQAASFGGGGKLVRDLLATTHGRDRAQVIGELQQAANREPAEADLGPEERAPVARRNVARRHVAFGELMYFPNEDLLKLMQAAPQEVLTLALAGADERLIERIMYILSRRDAKRLRRGIQLQGPTRLADIEDAQRRIETIASKILEEKDSAHRFLNSGHAGGPLDKHWA